MTIGFIFWLIMILVLVFGGNWGYVNRGNPWGIGVGFLTYVLLFLLGWRVFGFPIQG